MLSRIFHIFNHFKGQWLLYVPAGFRYKEITILSRVHVCVLCGSWNEKQLFAFMALTDWCILWRCNVLLDRTAASLIIQVHVYL